MNNPYLQDLIFAAQTTTLRDLLEVLTLTILIYILIRLTRLATRFYEHLRAWRRGCLLPILYPHTDPQKGSDLHLLRQSSLRSGTLPNLSLQHYRALGETWQEVANGCPVINTIASENVRDIYGTHVERFEDAVKPGWAEQRLFGNGVRGEGCEDGEEGCTWRRRVEVAFAGCEKGMMPVVRRHVDGLLTEVPRDGSGFDVDVLLKRMFLDLTTELLFGEPLGMQQPDKRLEAEAFLETLDSVILGLNKRREALSLETIKLWFDSSYAADVAKAHVFIDSRVHTALARTSSPPTSDIQSYGTFDSSDVSTSTSTSTPDRFTLIDELAKQVRDPESLRSCMLQCLLPSRDDTAILTSNTLSTLARHPHHWTRLRPLALSLTDVETLSLSHISSLHPLRNIILETLRLYGPFGCDTIQRRATVDLILPKGGGPDGESQLFVPKGMVVQTHLPAMHRKKRHWGEDADEYRPERFEGRVLGWEFCPFPAGRGRCPAREMGLVQVLYVLVRLLREFEGIEGRDEVQEFIEKGGMTSGSRRGVLISLIPARDGVVAAAAADGPDDNDDNRKQ